MHNAFSQFQGQIEQLYSDDMQSSLPFWYDCQAISKGENTVLPTESIFMVRFQLYK